MKRSIFFLFIVILSNMNFVYSQDSATIKKDTISPKPIFPQNEYRFSVKKIILPATLVTYGILSLTVPPLKTLNHSTADEIQEDQPKKVVWDNYTQYIPVAMVYGANAFGFQGKHNFKERTILLGTTALITAGIVEPIKYIVKEERPDKSNSYSFPSGHTATAFATATFQYMEYKDENIWFALAGYPFAVFTGVYRIVNNKHYIGDVAAGAGIGILSTQAAYWLFPKINKLFSKKKENANVMVAPFYQNGAIGLGLVKVF